MACDLKLHDWVAALLEINTAALHYTNMKLNTPLHIAITRRAKNTILLLLSYGAEPLASNKDKNTCMDLAKTQRCDAEIMEALHANQRLIKSVRLADGNECKEENTVTAFRISQEIDDKEQKDSRQVLNNPFVTPVKQRREIDEAQTAPKLGDADIRTPSLVMPFMLSQTPS